MMRGYEDVSSLRDKDAKSVDNLFLGLICGQSCCPINAKSDAVISRGHTYPTHLGTSPSYHKKTTRKKK